MPIAAGTMQAPITAAEPLDEPPGVRPGRTDWWSGPETRRPSRSSRSCQRLLLPHHACPHDRRVPLKVRNARDRGIFVMSGSDTGNASAFNHGRWHGKEAELLVKEVGMPPMEAIVANTRSNASLMGLEGGSA